MGMHHEQSYYTAVNTLALVHDQFLTALQIIAYIALIIGVIALIVYNKKKANLPNEDIAKKSVPWLIAFIVMVGFPSFIPIDFPGVAFLIANALAPVLSSIPGEFPTNVPIRFNFALALLDLAVFGALIVIPFVFTVTLPKKKEDEEEEAEVENASDSEPEADPGSETETNAKPGSESDSEPKSETEPDSEAESEPEAEAESDSGTEVESEVEPEGDVQPGSASDE